MSKRVWQQRTRLREQSKHKLLRFQSSGYLAAALGCMAASAILKFSGKDDWALFVGQWPAPLLIMGVYNKMVKQHGSDARSDFTERAASSWF